MPSVRGETRLRLLSANRPAEPRRPRGSGANTTWWMARVTATYTSSISSWASACGALAGARPVPRLSGKLGGRLEAEVEAVLTVRDLPRGLALGVQRAVHPGDDNVWEHSALCPMNRHDADRASGRRGSFVTGEGRVIAANCPRFEPVPSARRMAILAKYYPVEHGPA
jgi:hypothetical protein